MSLAYIVAAAPWGPVRFEVADSLADLASRISAAPAHVERIDGKDARQVVEMAARTLGPADGGGWIAAKVDAAIKALRSAVEACSPVLATP